MLMRVARANLRKRPGAKNGEMEMTTRTIKTCTLVAGTAAVVALLSATVLLTPQSAFAKPEYVAKVGKPCGACHVKATGGGKLTSYGEAFKANGFKAPKK
jgi:hypothetical protein